MNRVSDTYQRSLPIRQIIGTRYSAVLRTRIHSRYVDAKYASLLIERDKKLRKIPDRPDFSGITFGIAWMLLSEQSRNPKK